MLDRKIAEALLSIGAVSLSPNKPFTWTSGIKSPIYCDNRLIMSHPDLREIIAEGFTNIIRTHYPDVEVIAGTATAGIPHAAWVAQKLQLPMIYIRDKAKGHGKLNLIEGALKPTQKVAVIEDLISTGGSSLKAALSVNDSGGIACAVLAIFTYQFEQAYLAFRKEDIPLHTLTNYSVLIDVALQTGRIDADDVVSLKAWRQQPETYFN
jgi:orotate phosphoribosyltransferase